jgi:hypothetical protein
VRKATVYRRGFARAVGFRRRLRGGDESTIYRLAGRLPCPRRCGFDTDVGLAHRGLWWRRWRRRRRIDSDAVANADRFRHAHALSDADRFRHAISFAVSDTVRIAVSVAVGVAHAVSLAVADRIAIAVSLADADRIAIAVSLADADRIAVSFSLADADRIAVTLTIADAISDTDGHPDSVAVADSVRWDSRDYFGDARKVA